MNRRRRLTAVVAVIISALLLGVLFLVQWRKNSLSENTDMNHMDDSYSYFLGTQFSDEGILYNSGEYIRYADVESGEDGLICTEPSCEHKISRKSECGSVIAGMMGGLAQRGDKLYYIADDKEKIGKSALYSMNLAGKERKKIAVLAGMQTISDVIYHGTKVYVLYSNYDYSTDKNDFGVYCFDLEEKVGKNIYHNDRTALFLDGMVIGDGVIYFSYGTSDVSDEQIVAHASDEAYQEKHRISRVMGINLKTEKQVVELDGYGSNAVLPYAGGRIFFNKGSENYIYCIEEKKEVRISRDNLIPKHSEGFSDRVFYMKYNKKKQENIYYAYDVNKESLQELGSAGTEYSLFAVLPEFTYFLDDNSRYAYLQTEDFLKGNFRDIKPFAG